MTAAEYQAQHGQKGTATRSAAPRPPNTNPDAPEARTTEIPPPHFGQLPGPCTWVLPGGHALSLAAPFDPARSRLVLTGPTDAALLRKVLSALGL